MLAGPGEAIVGRGLLDALHLRVGDRLRVRREGAPLDLRIVGRYVEPDNDGRTAIFDRRSVPPARARALRPAADGCSCTAAEAPRCRRRWCGHRAGDRREVTEDEVNQERADLRPVVWGIDIVLLAIGLVNLLTTLLLGIRERGATSRSSRWSG